MAKTLHQKLWEIRKQVSYLQKAAQGHQYNYTPSSQVLHSVRDKMDELGVLIITEILDKRVHMETVETTDRSGQPKKTTTYFTELDLKVSWVNAEDPSDKIEIPWYGQGIDTAGEKGVGKALTYAEKYFILKQFNIATDRDDPDAFQRKYDDEDEKPKKAPAPLATDGPRKDPREDAAVVLLKVQRLKEMGVDQKKTEESLYKKLKADTGAVATAVSEIPPHLLKWAAEYLDGLIAIREQQKSASVS